MSSLLTTTAGRSLFGSDPRASRRLTHQISPRCGAVLFGGIAQGIATLAERHTRRCIKPFTNRRVMEVVIDSAFRSLTQNLPPCFLRQLEQFPRGQAGRRTLG